MSEALERLAWPADRIRAHAYRALGVRVSRALANRSTRVVVFGVVGLVALFVAACTVPALLLAFGPLVFGVPHVAADVRYLVVRPGFHRRYALAWLCAAPILAATWWWPHLWVGVLAPIAVLAVGPGDVVRRVVGVVVAGALAAIGWRGAALADLAFAHAHNAIAFGFFFAWAPRGRGRLLVCGLFVAGCVALLSGVGGAHDVAAYLDGPTPLVVCFAFAQGAHYLVWLRLVPDEDRPIPTPRSYRSSVRALVGDLGVPLCAAFAITWIATLAWSAVDAEAARRGYLRAAIVHGHLELCAVALLWLEARSPREATSGPRR